MKNLSGMTFGRLTALYRSGTDGSRCAVWHCECSCGVTKEISGHSLRLGLTRSCGCLHKEIVNAPLRPLSDRFAEKVNKTPEGCWLWIGAIDEETGYGKLLGADGNVTGAHRVSFSMFKGTIPVGLDVCHKCNVRACVNPEHLYTGTRKENMQQAKNDGRLGRHAGN